MRYECELSTKGLSYSLLLILATGFTPKVLWNSLHVDTPQLNENALSQRASSLSDVIFCLGEGHAPRYRLAMDSEGDRIKFNAKVINQNQNIPTFENVYVIGLNDFRNTLPSDVPAFRKE